MSDTNLPLHRPSHLVRITQLFAIALSVIAILGTVVLAWLPGYWSAASVVATWGLMMVVLGWAFPRLGTTWVGMVNAVVFLTGYAIIGALFRTEWFWREVVSRHDNLLWHLDDELFRAHFFSLLLFLAIPVFLVEILLWSAPRRRFGTGVTFCLSLSAICIGVLLLANIMVEATWSEVLFPLAATCVAFLVTRGLAGSGAWIRRACRENHQLRLASFLLPLALLVQIGALWWGLRPVYDPFTPMRLAHGVRMFLADTYPHWKTNPATLDGLWLDYEDDLLRASQNCPTGESPCYPVLRTLRDVVAGLQNGHTGLQIPEDIGAVPLGIRLVSDGLGIEWVKPGSPAAAAGLRPGQRVVEVDGLPVDDAARGVPAWQQAFASAERREWESYRSLLRGKPGTSVTVVTEDANRTRRSVTLQREAPSSFWTDWYTGEEDDSLEGEIDSFGIAYLRIDGFSDFDTFDRFDALFETLRAAPGFILDLRGNQGGYSYIARGVMNAFLGTEVLLGTMCRRAIDSDQETCKEEWAGYLDSVYDGTLAVLIDEETFSAGEWTAYALCRIGPGRCFGRTTAGETDSVVSEVIPGGVIHISRGRFHPSVGPAVLGHGVEPDERVALLLEDLRSGEDRVREAARRWLLGEIEGRSSSTRAGVPPPSARSTSSFPASGTRPGAPADAVDVP